MKLTPYLLFDGNCTEAMTFYKACLGGELTITTLGDSSMKGQYPPEQQNKVINARLTNGAIDISASDWLHPTRTPIGSYGALTDTFAVRWMFQGEKQG